MRYPVAEDSEDFLCLIATTVEGFRGPACGLKRTAGHASTVLPLAQHESV